MSWSDYFHFIIPFVIALVSSLICVLTNVIIIGLMVLVLGFAYEWMQLRGDIDANYGGLNNFITDSNADILLMFLGMVFGYCIGFILRGIF